MTNIYGVLNTARVSILTQQAGIEVTGQNLANVNTDGYSRQILSLEATPAIAAGNAMIGTGVKITEIKRNVDDFINSQLNSNNSDKSYYGTAAQTLSTLETFFNESGDRGLVDSINRFFSAFQDLAVNAQSLTERNAVLGTANLLSDTMNRLATNISQVKTNTENQVKQSVTDINVLTTQIAELNKQIHEIEKSNVYANDLRDRRDLQVKELAGIMDIAVYEDSANNEFMVTTTKGKHLVLGQTSFDLETSLNGDNFGLVDININDGQDNLTNITTEISSGSLQGHLYMRDTVLPDYVKRLDKLAAGMIREVNRLHTSGYDLDQNSGVDFFDPLSVTARADTDNTGSASISGTVAQQGYVSTDDYTVTITGSNTYSLYNDTTGASSGNFTFSSGSAVDLGNGLMITLSGSASTGDIFTFSSSENAALTMGVNSTIKSSPSKIAAAKTLFPGDGSNATDIAELQNSLTFADNQLLAGSGTVTFQSYYGSLISDVGIESMKAGFGQDQQDAIYKQLFNQRENISGVSIDEEMVNIVKFQQAYNASAKIIVAVEEMLTTLQQAV